MGIVGFVILGLVAGAIARTVHRGPEPGGMVGTLVVGVLGALLGGLVASIVGLGALGRFFAPGTWLVAIAGAALLLALYQATAATPTHEGTTV